VILAQVSASDPAIEFANESQLNPVRHFGSPLERMDIETKNLIEPDQRSLQRDDGRHKV
jgi:hypothetical protein